ncbi:deoxyribodipyrimidine photo-lyase [Shewanella sp. JM162201]|uniref:Deoxyribodipyrimidine photo-lyase n=1 Tax=Shewanella jiangmenensis TaxID=2837387 RepID=A0ABS5V1Z4_9GAMM|nr:FAD-binding domain-containing protein [Shewanella jiangmenensis]MBT1444435.1 deoxyribodipyrimidine photo-lyase [Shewanella jiangmenensis]
MNTLVWFRQDLRTLDNQALTLACEDAKARGAKLYGVFIASPAQWQTHDMGQRQQRFLLANLNALGERLAALGIPLELMVVPWFNGTAAALKGFCKARGISRIFAGAQVEIDERRRDASLIEKGFPLHLTDEHCILPPGSVVTQGQRAGQGGAMYRVFTPFARRWREIAAARPLWPIPSPAAVAPALSFEPFPFWGDSVANSPGAASKSPGAAVSESDTACANPSEDGALALWPAGEDAALEKLRGFQQRSLARYAERRDFPAIDGTSSLSPYLALGVISPRQCLASLLEAFPEVFVSESSPARTWLNELVWREFYRHLLVAFPSLSMAKNFNPLADAIVWRNDEREFEAWKAGRTGYPLVDAAMRQLQQTGWMHNRLRMVVASFLTKHLLIDWRWGERYFREQLIDGCLAANNGGWQWAAGTGCDAQPYFRIFNPMSQSEKFDPDGRFIRKYLPEIAHWPTKALHQASGTGQVANGLFDNGLSKNDSYPSPIVEHSRARLRALEVMTVMKKG